MSEQNKALVRRVYEDVISRGDLDLVDQLFGADYRETDPANDVDTETPEGVRQEVAGYRSAFPDLVMTVEEQLADGDRVATRFSCRGTHRGELLGVPPSGAQIGMTGIAIHRIADGKIAEAHWNWDTLGMLKQIGAIALEEAVAAQRQ